MRLMAIAVAVLVLAGCPAPSEQSRERKENARTVKKVTSDTVKTMSGYDQIVAGRRAQDRVKQANAQHTKDLNDVGVDVKR